MQVEPVKITPSQYVNTKSEYQSDYSSKSQFNDKPSLASNNDILNNLLGGTKQQFTNSNSWQPPTVDSGFGSKVAPAYTQNINFAQSNHLSAAMGDNFQKNYPTQSNLTILNDNNIKIGGYTQPNSYNNLNGINSFTNSNIAINYGNIQKPGSAFNEFKVDSKVELKKPASYNPPPQTTYELKQPGFYDPKIISPAPYLPTYPAVPKGKNPCGLNVS